MLAKSKNLGIAGFFAYFLIFLNTISGFLIGPFLLSKIGDSIYGVYTTIFSFASALTMADVGVTQTLIRYIANYKSENKTDEETSILCRTIRLINYVVIGVTLLASLGLYFALPHFYSDRFTLEEIRTAKNLFVIFSCSIAITIFSNYYSGIICGNGYFAYINITKSISVVLRLILIFVILTYKQNIYIIAFIDLALSVFIMLANLFFQKKNIRICKSKGWLPKFLLKEVLIFTGFVILQSLIDQINNNLDNILIGAVVGSVAVAAYSFGLTLFHMFQNLSTSISQMLVPYMSDRIASQVSNKELENDLVKIGKIQFAIIGAIIFGFSILGKMFIKLWLGSELGSDCLNVWIVTMILMGGGVLPLIQNGAIAILKAKNLMLFRTIALLIMAVINACLTFFLVKHFGYVYAAVGTAAGFILVNTTIMDIYYLKKLNLNMFRVLGLILVRLVPCNLIPAVIVFVLKGLLSDSYWWLACLVLIYCLIYLFCLLLLGFTSGEKKFLKGYFLRKK